MSSCGTLDEFLKSSISRYRIIELTFFHGDKIALRHNIKHKVIIFKTCMSVNLTVEASFTGWVTRNVDSVTPDSGSRSRSLCSEFVLYFSSI